MNHHYEWFFYNNEADFRIFKSENINYLAHLHMQFEVLYVLAGEINVTINGKNYCLVQNEVAIVTPNQIHSYESKNENSMYTMIFESQLVTDFSKFFKNKKPVDPVLSVWDQAEEFKDLFEKLHNAKLHDENKLIISGYVNLILGRLLERLEFCEDQGDESMTLQKILLYVERNYDKKITLDILAREVGVTRYHISRIFNQKIGVSFSDYVKAIRIANATQLLSTDMSIIQVALESGFENIRSFYRAFNEAYQITPQNFRREKISKSS